MVRIKSIVLVMVRIRIKSGIMIGKKQYNKLINRAQNAGHFKFCEPESDNEILIYYI